MEAFNTILVIRLSSIGDIILTTPLLRRLGVAFPGARIDYCTKSPFTSLLASNPRISSIYTPDDLPQGAYDLVVDLQNNIRSHQIVRSLRARQTLCYRKGSWKKWLMVHFKIDLDRSERSVVERYQDALKTFSLSDDPEGCELYPTSAERAFAEPFFASGSKTLALCFGANHFTKRYPPDRFASLLSRLLREQPMQVILLGGEEDAPIALQILSALPDFQRSLVTSLAGSCSLMQTAAILERCDAVLTNDTGLMHMASAFGKKLFVLFGSSASTFGFLPYHVPYDLFQVEGLACRPCSHIGRNHCPKGHFRCMNDLSAPVIVEHILDHFTFVPLKK